MIRIFNYLNISNSRDIWADSGYHVQRNLVNHILEKRNDFFFYITVPRNQLREALKGFRYPEYIELIPLNYTRYGSLNKIHIDLRGLKERFSPRHRMINIIWSNEAYLTPYLLQLFKSTLPYSGAAVATYVHWMELPSYTATGDKYRGNWQLWLLATAIYWSDYSFFLSNHALKTITPYLESFLNPRTYNELLPKMKVLYHGIPVEELDKYKTSEVPDKPLIVFNHRLMEYTGVRSVIRVLKRLLKEAGKGFRIVFTNPSKHSISSIQELMLLREKYPDHIVLHDSLPYPDYIRLLWRADAVIAWHNHWWSIAVLEAVACETYPIAHNQAFFPEILPRTILLEYRDETLYNTLLDLIKNPDHYRREAKKLSSYVRERFGWRNRVSEWIEYLEKLYGIAGSRATRPTGETIRRIDLLIRRKKRITWSEIWRLFNWGYQYRDGRMGVYFWLSRNYRELPLPEPTWVLEETRTDLRRWM